MSPKTFSPNMRDILVAADGYRVRFNTPLESFDVISALENVLEFGVILDVVDQVPKGTLSEDQEAFLDCYNGCLSVKEAVYEGASMGNPSDRFTLAHEIGHVVLHFGKVSSLSKLARGKPGSGTSFANNSMWEREANEFAGTLLLPLQAIGPETTADEAMRKYKISRPAADATLKRTRAAFPGKWRPGS